MKEWNSLNHISGRIMEEKRKWGWYKVLEYVKYEENRKSLVKHLYLDKDQNISYQRHKKRDEIWIIVHGNGLAVINDESIKITIGDVLTIKKGAEHMLFAKTNMHIVEVQIGTELEEEDIERIPFPRSKWQ